MANTSPSASEYFNANWDRYQQTIKSNTLYHKEMAATLDKFLGDHLGAMPFSFVDFGCGDCSTIIDVLKNRKLTQYIGIDAASDVLHLAKDNMAIINCSKEFICENMIDAVKKLDSKYNIIFTSYAAHHLTSQEKKDFLRHCKDTLDENGYLIMIDCVLGKGQSRDEWLDKIEQRMQRTQSIPDDQIDERMKHPRANDFPEETATFQQIANDQGWKKFDVLLDKELYAFMVFSK